MNEYIEYVRIMGDFPKHKQGNCEIILPFSKYLTNSFEKALGLTYIYKYI